jgi:ubiquitin carboxyl-terminal hydrolase 4/11/15
VSASAYLLFYRRRSEGPLGGPKLQETISSLETRETSEEDEAESGEGQGLVANSSLRGSSSALTGVGAALHQTNGSGTGQGQMKTVNLQDLEGLPAYQAHESEEDAAPLLQSDAEMNDGLGIHPSIEDEGIDMGYNTMNTNQNILNFTAVNQGFNPTQNWNFSGLEDINNARQHNLRISGTGSEIDCNANSGFDVDGSDVVEHDSSASEGSLQGRLEDFDNATAMDDDGGLFEDPSPVPDVDDENQIDPLELHRELLESRGRAPEFQVHAPEQEEDIEEPAAEIHIDESDELKID